MKNITYHYFNEKTITRYNASCRKAPFSSKNYYYWRSGTINVRTMREQHDISKLPYAIRQITNAKIDICALQEVRMRGSGSFIQDDYAVYFNGYKNKSQAGVMIAVKKNIHVNNIINVSPRLLVAEISIGSLKVKVLCCYAPTEEATEHTKSTFYRDIKSNSSTTKRQHLLLLGDFNATTTAIKHRATYFNGKPAEDIQSNDNGSRLVQLCAEKHLSILNTFFRQKPVNSYTWYSNDGRTRKIYDLALSDNFLRRYVTNTRVRRSYDFHSDHRLVISRFRTPKKKVDMKNTNRKKSSTKINYKIATTEQVNNFVNAIEKQSKNITTAESIIELLDTTAKTTLPHLCRLKKQSFQWDNDDILNQLLLQRKRHHIQFEKIKYRKLTNTIKRRVHFLRNAHYKAEAMQFSTAITNREIEKAYTIAKNQRTTRRGKAPSIKCPGLLNYFKSHFNPDYRDLPTPISLQEQSVLKINSTVNEEPPSKTEIISVIQQMKNQKSSLDIPAEALKLALESNNFICEITKFYQNLWSTTNIPSYFSYGEITTIFKNKGSLSDPSKYRGITLSSILTKILVKIILHRILNVYDCSLNEGQMGFRPNRGTNDGTYCIKRVQQWATKQQRQIYVAMVDLSAAFDTVHREWLFTSVRLILGENSAIVNILQKLYSQTVCKLRGGKLEFTVSHGVRQGGPESPPLYNIYADNALQTFVNKCNSHGLTPLKIPFKIPKICSTDSHSINEGLLQLHWLGYADDIVLFSENQVDLSKMLSILHQVFTEYALKINFSKTETLILNWKNTTAYPETIANINGNEIANVKSFKYLGSYIQHNNSSTGDLEIDSRITAATCKFFELGAFYKNHKIKLKTRIAFLESLVRSRLTYGCQCWSPTQQQFKKLDSCYTKLIRHMIRGGFQRQKDALSYTTKDGDEKTFKKLKFTNENIQKISGAKTVSEFIKERQSDWIGHCVRADDMRYIKKLTFLDYHKGESKKRGITDSTFRQVQRRSTHINETNWLNSFL